MDELLMFFSLARLVEGAFCLYMGTRFRRGAVTLWGVVAVLLAIPVAALSFGVDLPRGSVVAIAGGHAVLGMCVVAAMVSSTAEARRSIVGRPTPTDRWRP